MPRSLQEYDIVAVGSGSGATIADAAVGQGLSVALVDKGPLGGTCENFGCIPSKLIIAAADRVTEIQEADGFGISAHITGVDFPATMRRMRRLRLETREGMRDRLERVENLDLYAVQASFEDARTLRVGEDRIAGERIFIVTGARPLVPLVDGLSEIAYLDNESVFELTECPASIVMIGGGYIACEFAHFFAAMGSEVAILQRNRYLVPEEEPEISQRLFELLSQRVKVHVQTEVTRVAPDGDGYRVVAETWPGGETLELTGQQVLVAVGRRSNADLLQVQNAGIQTDRRGYIEVNEYPETNVPRVWALGDVIGKQMFKHVANHEARLAWHNSRSDQ